MNSETKKQLNLFSKGAQGIILQTFKVKLIYESINKFQLYIQGVINNSISTFYLKGNTFSLRTKINSAIDKVASNTPTKIRVMLFSGFCSVTFGSCWEIILFAFFFLLISFAVHQLIKILIVDVPTTKVSLSSTLHHSKIKSILNY